MKVAAIAIMASKPPATGDLIDISKFRINDITAPNDPPPVCGEAVHSSVR